ncbi:hypothetical protein [Streptomyces sp. LN325]|uniref:hypothetical protein n=1 Tax=Streptomyces sp. LN325 TaxID=3112976 RepID=UPI0037221C5C
MVLGFGAEELGLRHRRGNRRPDVDEFQRQATQPGLPDPRSAASRRSAKPSMPALTVQGMVSTS